MVQREWSIRVTEPREKDSRSCERREESVPRPRLSFTPSTKGLHLVPPGFVLPGSVEQWTDEGYEYESYESRSWDRQYQQHAICEIHTPFGKMFLMLFFNFMNLVIAVIADFLVFALVIRKEQLPQLPQLPLLQVQLAQGLEGDEPPSWYTKPPDGASATPPRPRGPTAQATAEVATNSQASSERT